MKKIILFSYNSSFTHTSLALRCLRTSLCSCGDDFDVSIIEKTEKDSYEHILHALFSKHADIYGFSCYIWNIAATEKLAKDLKALCPSALIVFGGPEVSFYGKDFFDSHSYVDTLIKGEGEKAIVDVAKYSLTGIIEGGEYDDFTSAGIHYTNDEGSHSIVYYESSRGCPYRCSYCLSASSAHLRAKPIEKVLSDLYDFEALGDIKIIKFVDRTFNADKKRAYAVWESLLSSKFTKNYHFEVCASLIDDEAIILLSRFPKGKIQLEIGVQSTNPTVLKAINRHDDPEKVLSVIERLHNLGNMHIHADLIAGLPLEDIQSFENSFNSLYGKCDMLQLGFLKLLHGAPIEKDTEKYGYIFSSYPPYTVLRNDFMSEDDFARLFDIEKALDRYSSRAFKKSVSYLTKRITPFELFESLALLAKDITKLSQREAFEVLYTYACRSGLADDEFLSLIRLDFLLSETSRLPKCIYLEPINDQKLRSTFAHENRDFSLQSLEIYPWNDRLLYIDRKNKHFALR